MLIKKWKLKKDLRKFIFENDYNWIDFTKRSYYLLKKAKKHLVLFATNSAREIPDPTKTREHNEFQKKVKKNPKATKAVKSPYNSDIKYVAVKLLLIYQSLYISQI